MVKSKVCESLTSNFSKILILIFLISLVAASQIQAQDPGIRDTIRVSADTLIVGQSRPIRVTVCNDDLVRSIILPFEIGPIDSGFAVFDSMVFVNRMADPTVIDGRGINLIHANGTPYDTIQPYAFLLSGNYLQPGNTAILEIYFTGITAGMMAIDSIPFPLGGGSSFNNLSLVIQGEQPFEYFLAYPEFETQPITVIEGTPPPVVVLDEELIRETAGSNISVDVNISSPVSFPLTATLESFAAIDNSTITPTSTPSLTYSGSGGLYSLDWTSAGNDIGIWKAVISACDSSGTCSNVEMRFQVVEDGSFLVDMNEMVSEYSHFVPYGMDFGNFDNDNEAELAAGMMWPFSPGVSFALHDYQSNGSFTDAFTQDDPIMPRRGLKAAFVNDDTYLDVIQFTYLVHISGVDEGQMLVLLGNGQNGFDSSVITTLPHSGFVGTMCNFNDDQYLDYAIGNREKLWLYEGNSNSEYDELGSIDVGDSIMTVVAQDLNNDGYNDFVIGHRNGIKVYKGNPAPGSYTLTASYAQEFGSVSIEVTNNGSDFNNDNVFDLCVATPSVGDSSSELVVYTGNGDATFSQNVVRQVLGQINSNIPGDFNGDGNLDIAFLNTSKKYVSVIFGDGDGNFTNELRYDALSYTPIRLVSADIDADGDIDIIVFSWNGSSSGSLTVFENQSDPGSYSQTSVAFTGEDNAQLELVSPTLKKVNRISSSIPTANYYRRNSNSNSLLDDYASLNLVESGEYVLNVTADPSQPLGNLFSVEFEVDGLPYRLAKDQAMNTGQYEFGVSLTGIGGSAPLSGSFVIVNPPVFAWPSKSNVDFQLATDLDFTNVLIETTVEGSSFQPAGALPISDTSTYYWRIKPSGAEDFGPIYALNLTSGSLVCGDIDGVSGALNTLDLIYLINRIFRLGPPLPNLQSADLNGDGFANVLDLNILINYIFRLGPMPTCD